MTLRDWLAQAEAQLSDGPHSDRAKRDAETLLLHVIGKNKAWLMAHAEDDFAGCSAIRYAGLIERRRKGEPIQYITGECEFYGLPFHVTPDVLIPRPETEHLVEKIIELATPGAFNLEEMLEGPQNPGAPSFRRSLPDGWESTNPAPSIRILDVGTGSGAIAIALAHQTSQRDLTAIDISQSALAIARGKCNPQQPGRANPLPARRSPRARGRRALRNHRLQPALRSRYRPRPHLRRSSRPRTPHRPLRWPRRPRNLSPSHSRRSRRTHSRRLSRLRIRLQPDARCRISSSRTAGFQNIEFTPDLQGIPRVALPVVMQKLILNQLHAEFVTDSPASDRPVLNHRRA